MQSHLALSLSLSRNPSSKYLVRLPPLVCLALPGGGDKGTFAASLSLLVHSNGRRSDGRTDGRMGRAQKERKEEEEDVGRQ